jgi:phosphonate transport system permease protein
MPALLSAVSSRTDGRGTAAAFRYPDPAARWLGGRGWRFAAGLAAAVLIYGLCLSVAEIDPARLWRGLPRLAGWAVRAWPPDLSELTLLLRRAAETLAIATLGTTAAVLLAAPLALLGARNVAPGALLHYPARWVLNMLRGIDSFVFVLLFVAAVGLGPFAGVIGVTLHSAGSIAKLWAEAIEAVEPGPLEAAAMTGAGRLKIVLYALLPDVLPTLASTALYVWEFNVRSSTVLGLVGAGGIGQELKNSVDLLVFPRVLTILLIILAMVTLIDQLSAWLRRRLL